MTTRKGGKMKPVDDRELGERAIRLVLEMIADHALWENLTPRERRMVFRPSFLRRWLRRAHQLAGDNERRRT